MPGYAIQRTVHRYIFLFQKPTTCTNSQIYFDKELYMSQANLLSIIRGLNAVFTAACICHAEACNTDTTPIQPHRNSNTHRIKNNTTNVVIQQNRRKLLMMDILMSETCWAHKKWNKISSDIKLVFYSSTKTKHVAHKTLRYKWHHKRV